MTTEVQLKQLARGLALTDDLIAWNGTLWVPVSSPRVVSLGVGVAAPATAGIIAAASAINSGLYSRKGSDETFVDTTLNDDNQLFNFYDETGPYDIDIFAQCAGSSGDDFKVSLAAQGGLTASAIAWYVWCWDNGSTSWTFSNGSTSLGTSISGVLTSSGAHVVRIKGSINVSAPGELQVQWAKLTDVSGDFTVRTGSTFRSDQMNN